MPTFLTRRRLLPCKVIILPWFEIKFLSEFKERLIILPSFIFNYACIINSFFPGYEKYELPPLHAFHRQLIVRNDPKFEVRQQRYMRSLKKNSLNNIIKIKEPLIYFKDEEIKIGYNYLKKIGLHENNFICCNARDRAFLSKYNRDIDWSYHDFRNSDILLILLESSISLETKINFLAFSFFII